MIEPLLPSFSNECTKIAAKLTSAHFKVEDFHTSEAKDWRQFEKDLKSKQFKQLLIGDGRSDEKLKKYVTNFGGYLGSKKVLGTVPSRTSTKSYKIKELPSGRLGCSCRDWQYSHSVKDSDCSHVRSYKATESLRKTSSARSMAAVLRLYQRGQESMKRGKAVEKNPYLLLGAH